MKVVAIGDIHGQYRHLNLMLDAIKDVDHDHIVFIGDYIDRGESSREVIKIIRQLSNVTLLCGNHEDMAIRSLTSGYWRQNWVANGGDKVLKEYECDYSNFSQELVADLMWLNEHTELYKIIDDHMFVHAGINPYLELDNNVQSEDMLWIRKEFLKYKDPMPYYIVHGHTPYDDDFTKITGDIDIRDNRCNLDGGCVYGGKLVGALFDTESDNLKPLKIFRVGEMEAAINVCEVEDIV
ncbi:serine/threonine protein phosphatase [Ochrobactrum phage vB_OspM_OC]|nr:serine/threonine protein phosphatase [Ochrobactrum phage vB_OspM_OC]